MAGGERVAGGQWMTGREGVVGCEWMVGCKWVVGSEWVVGCAGLWCGMLQGGVLCLLFQHAGHGAGWVVCLQGLVLHLYVLRLTAGVGPHHGRRVLATVTIQVHVLLTPGTRHHVQADGGQTGPTWAADGPLHPRTRRPHAAGLTRHRHRETEVLWLGVVRRMQVAGVQCTRLRDGCHRCWHQVMSPTDRAGHRGNCLHTVLLLLLLLLEHHLEGREPRTVRGGGGWPCRAAGRGQAGGGHRGWGRSQGLLWVLWGLWQLPTRLLVLLQGLLKNRGNDTT